MGTERPGKLIVRYALPSILTMVVSSLYNVVDKIFIGNAVGYLGLAATTAAASIMMLLSTFAALIGTGSSIQLAMALGKGERERASRVAAAALTMELALGMLLVLAGSLLLAPLCRLTGAGNDALPYLTQYLRIIFGGALFLCVGTGLLPVIRAEGCPRAAFVIGCSGSVCNCILDAAFIYGLGMGIRGAALATVLSQLFSAGLAAFFLLFNKTSGLRLKKNDFLPRKAIVWDTLRLGFPGMLMNIVTCGMVLVFTNTLRRYGTAEISGDAAISALGLSTSIGDLIMTVSIGMQQGLEPLIAYNHTAGNQKRVKTIFRYGFLALFLILLVFWGVIELFPRTLIGFFGEPGNPDFAVFTVRVYNLALPLLVVQLLGGMYLQATGQVKQASILALARNVFLGIPLLLILPLFWGVHGAMVMGPIADTGGAVLSGILMSRAFRRTEKQTLAANSS